MFLLAYLNPNPNTPFLQDSEEATRTLFMALRPRGYSRCFLREIKAEIVLTFQSSGDYKKTKSFNRC